MRLSTGRRLARTTGGTPCTRRTLRTVNRRCYWGVVAVEVATPVEASCPSTRRYRPIIPGTPKPLNAIV